VYQCLYYVYDSIVKQVQEMLQIAVKKCEFKHDFVMGR